MTFLSFTEMLTKLLAVNGEPVAVAAGLIHGDGTATLTATFRGVLRVDGGLSVDEPVQLFADGDEAVALDPAEFVACYRTSTAIVVDAAPTCVEIMPQDADRASSTVSRRPRR